MHVLKDFWGDAILIVCFLVNRMPSSVLSNKSPHSVLFPNTLSFSLPVQVFSCTCFVHVLNPGQDELPFTAYKSIFLCYFKTQKWYRFYDPSSRYVFVSVDIIFFENTPFFSSEGKILDIDILSGPVKESSPYVDSHVFVPLPTPADAEVVQSEAPPSSKDSLTMYQRRSRAPLPLSHLL